MWNYLCLGECFLFSILLIIIFNSKQRIESQENNYFKLLIYSTILNIGCEIFLQYCTINLGTAHIATAFLARFYLITISIWFTCFSKYIFYLFKPSTDEHNYDQKSKKFEKNFKHVNRIHNIVFAISILFFSFLNIEYYINGNEMYSYGDAITYLRIFLGVYMLSWLIVSIKNFKKIFNKKYSPIFVAVILLLSNIILQKINPALLIVSFTLTFLDYLLFFTIENPDVKMLKMVEMEKDRADKANQAKTDFLSTMSHEIRTPLNAIVGFSESLKEESLTESQLEEVNDIIDASQTLLETVNGVLDISKIEAGKIEIVNSTYSFEKIFNELVKLAKARLGEDRPIEFKYYLAPDTPKYLYGDHVRIKQVILNFLTNAIKYTNKGYIDFDVKNICNKHTCRLIIKVEDSGMGIKKEAINRLFDKFDRLDNENSTIEGTGLGLAITKRLVEMMHGKIIVQSIYGKGSQFTIVIDQKIVNEAIAEEVVEKNEEKETITTDLTNKKVLIVDDNLMNLKVAARLLKSYNMQIEQADSGFKCLDLIGGGNTYDLILLDDMMPKMSGKETFKQLKEDPSFNTPVVILTANAITGMKEEYLQLGFDDYLAKPIEKDELNRVIKKFLDK